MKERIDNGSPAGMIEATTFAEAFQKSAELFADRLAVRTQDDAVSLTYGTLRERVHALAGGLAKLGLRRGQPLALMMSNRPEFYLADLAAVVLGAVPFSIYQTLAPEQIAYVVGDAGAGIAIVEQSFLDRFLQARTQLPAIKHLIVLDGTPPAGALSLAEVEQSDSAFDGEAAARSVKPDDLLTLIYTSGTTGPPKGVQVTHANLNAIVGGLNQVVHFPRNGRAISWLPTAHIAERAFNYYLPVLVGGAVTTCPNPREIISVLPHVRPHFFFAVPRIWEKLKAGLEARLESAPADQAAQMRRALTAGIEKVRLEQAGKAVPAPLAEQVARADTELFAPIRSMLGLEQVALVAVGAAPIARDVLEFFHGIGISLCEGWGMSETCAVGTINPPDRIRLGTVGPPIPGVEIKLEDDGEILIRGGNIMAGYRNQPDKTAEVIDADGWLATGDVGEIDEAGYLKIIDRKKELIINAAGKNMSPANIERAVKSAGPLIGHACAIGDRRPYNTALIVLDPEYAAAWAQQNGLAEKSPADLAGEPRVVAAVQEAVDRANAQLARVEQIKKFTIIAGEWQPGDDELTPTMKLKRKPIAEKYRREIDSMYAG